MNIVDCVIWLSSPLLLRLEVLNVLGSNRKPYAASLENHSDLPPPPWVNLGSLNQSLCFWLLSPLLLLLELLTVLGGNRNPKRQLD